MPRSLASLAGCRRQRLCSLSSIGATSPGKQLSLGSEIMEDVSRLFEIATHFTRHFNPGR
jgi:hypothetical protein